MGKVLFEGFVGQNGQCCQSPKEKKGTDSADSDDTASMNKGGGYIGARTRQPPTAQTIIEK
jgi:hypothetical protein